MKIKTFILTFLLMMMSSPIVFGQSRASVTTDVSNWEGLKEALTVFNTGQDEDEITVRLTADINIPADEAPIEILAGKNVTLNLNGYVIKAASTKYVFNNLGNLIIRDGGNENSAIEGRGIFNGRTTGEGQFINRDAKLTIENGIFRSTSTDGGAAIYNYGIADIQGGSFYAEYAAIANFGEMTINNARIIGENYAINNDSTLTIGNTYYYGTIDTGDLTAEVNPAVYTVSPEGSVKPFEAYLYVKDFYYNTSEDYYKTVAEAVSKINSYKDTPKEATLTLLVNTEINNQILISNNATVNLNNKKVTFKGGDQSRFKVTADVTFKNGTIEGPERCVYTFSDGKDIALNLENVNLTTTGTTGYQQPLTIAGTAAAETTTVDLKNVKIDAGTATGYGIISFVKTMLTADEDTEVSGYAALYAKDSSAGATGSAGSEFVFNGSTLIGNGGKEGEANSFSTIALEESNVTVKMNGGVAKSLGGNHAILGIGWTGDPIETGNTIILDATMDVTGGSQYLYMANANTNTVVVRSEYVDPSWSTEAYGEDLVQVKGIAVAKIGDVKYCSLAEAVEAATTDATIELLNADVDESAATVTINKKLNLKGEGIDKYKFPQIKLEGTANVSVAGTSYHPTTFEYFNVTVGELAQFIVKGYSTVNGTFVNNGSITLNTSTIGGKITNNKNIVVKNASDIIASEYSGNGTINLENVRMSATKLSGVGSVVATGTNDIVASTINARSFKVENEAIVNLNDNAYVNGISNGSTMTVNGTLNVTNSAVWYLNVNLAEASKLNVTGKHTINNTSIKNKEFIVNTQINVANGAEIFVASDAVLTAKKAVVAEDAVVALKFYANVTFTETVNNGTINLYLNEGKTFTTPEITEGLNVETEYGCIVSYENNAYKAIRILNEGDVAVIAETGIGYETLQDAINAVQDGQVIKLIKDIEYIDYVYASGKTTAVNIANNKQFTLDLNGFTIYGENSTTGNYELITIAQGTQLTIDDLSADKKGKISYKGTRTTADGWMRRCHTIFNQGSLIVNNGLIENITPVEAEAVASAIDNNASWGKLGHLTFNGGTVKSTSYYAVRTDVNTHNTSATSDNVAKTVFNGGEVYGFYLMDRGSDIYNNTQNPNNIDVDITENATIKPCEYTGQALRFFFNNKSPYDVEISEEAEIEGTIKGIDAKIGNKYYPLQGAIDAVPAVADAETTIEFIHDITSDATVSQAENKNIIIDGKEFKYSGTIYIHGNARHTGAETLTIQNVNFITATDTIPTHDFISSNSTGAVERYAHNVTVKDCNFTSTYTGEEKNEIVAMRFRQAYNINVIGGEFTNLHSVMQANGNTGTNFEGVKANCIEGVFSMTGGGENSSYSIKNSEFTSQGYGIRVGEGYSKNFNIEGCTITAPVPVAVRYAENGGPLYFTFGQNTMNSDNPYNYWFVAGTGKDEYDGGETLPTVGGQVVVNIDEDSDLGYEGVYGNYGVAQIGTVKYQSLEAAANAAQDGDVIQLLWQEGQTPILMRATFVGNKTVTITGTAEVIWEDDNNGTIDWFYVGRNGEGDGHVIFNEAYLTSKSNSTAFGFNVSGSKYGNDNTNDGTITIMNSDIELDYLINKNVMSLDNSTLTVKNGFAVGGRPGYDNQNNQDSESGEDATATMTLTNGSNVIVYNHNGMGLGYEAIGIMNIDETSSFEAKQNFLVSAKGTMNLAGEATIAAGKTLTNNGTINLTNTNAKLYTTTTGLSIKTDLTGYKANYYAATDEEAAHYKLLSNDEFNFVIKDSDGNIVNGYTTFPRAIDAAQDGQTVEIRTNGPIILGSDKTGGVVGKTVTVKAGEGFAPVKYDNNNRDMLVGNGAKVIFDGVEFIPRYELDANTKESGFVVNNGGIVEFVNGADITTDYITVNEGGIININNSNVNVNGTFINNNVVNVEGTSDIYVVDAEYQANSLSRGEGNFYMKNVVMNNSYMRGAKVTFTEGEENNIDNSTLMGVFCVNEGVTVNAGGNAYINSTIAGTTGVIAGNLNLTSTKNARFTNLKVNEGGKLDVANNSILAILGTLNNAGEIYLTPESAKVNFAKEGYEDAFSTQWDYEVYYEEGYYKVREIEFNFCINNEHDRSYLTFEEALANVANGDTIYITTDAQGNEASTIFTYNNAIEFTVTGDAQDYIIPRVTFENATVNIVNAKFSSPDIDARHNAKINIVGSVIHNDITQDGKNPTVKATSNGIINIDNSVISTCNLFAMGELNITNNAIVYATANTSVFETGKLNITDGAEVYIAPLALTGEEYDSTFTGAEPANPDDETPARLTVDNATLIVGNVIDIDGGNYGYHTEKYGIKVGTDADRTAFLDIKNGATVKFYMDPTTNKTYKQPLIGENGTINIEGSSFEVISRKEGETLALQNNGTINVTGESQIDVRTITGKAINMTNATLADSYVGGAINTFGTNNIVGTSNVTGLLSVGYNGTHETPAVLNITGNFNGTNVVVGSVGGHKLNVGVEAEMDVDNNITNRTTAHFANLGGHGDINIENTDVTYDYTYIRKNFNLNNSKMTNTFVNTYIAGNAVVNVTNSEWTVGEYSNIGSYGGDLWGNADVTLTDSKMIAKNNLGVEKSSTYNVKFTLVNSELQVKAFTNQGTVELKGNSTVTTDTFNNSGSITIGQGTQMTANKNIGNSGTLTVNGTLVADAQLNTTGTVTVNGNLNRTANAVNEINVNGGKMDVKGEVAANKINNNADFNVLEGGTVDVTYFQINADVDVTTPNYFFVGNNVTGNATFKMNNVALTAYSQLMYAKINFAGENTLTNANLTNSNVTVISGATLKVPHVQNMLNNTIKVTSLTNNGILEVDNGNAKVDATTVSNNATAIVNGTLTAATLNNNSSYSTLTVNGTLTATTSLSNVANATIEGTGNIGVDKNIAELTNNGEIEGDLTISAKTINNYNKIDVAEIVATNFYNTNMTYSSVIVDGATLQSVSFTNSGTVNVTGESVVKITNEVTDDTGNGQFVMEGVNLTSSNTNLYGAYIVFNGENSAKDLTFSGKYDFLTNIGIEVNGTLNIYGEVTATYLGTGEGTVVLKETTSKLTANTDLKLYPEEDPFVTSGVDGYHVVHGTNNIGLHNGVYTLKSNDAYVAMVNGNYYETIAGAIAATDDATDTVTIVRKDIVENVIVEGKNITFVSAEDVNDVVVTGNLTVSSTVNFSAFNVTFADVNLKAGAKMNIDHATFTATQIATKGQNANIYVGEGSVVNAHIRVQHTGTDIDIDGTVNASSVYVSPNEINNYSINLGAHEATLVTVTEGLNVETDYADHKVSYKNGKYQLVGKYVAQIDDVKYETLADALVAVPSNGTVELLWEEGNDPIVMAGILTGKNAKITQAVATDSIYVDWSKGWLFIARGAEYNNGPSKLTFEGVNLYSVNDGVGTDNNRYGINVSAKRKNTENYNGTLVIKDSYVELSYLYNAYEATFDNSTVTLVNANGMNVGGLLGAYTTTGQAGTATLNIENGTTFNVTNITIGYDGIGIMNVDATSVVNTKPQYGLNVIEGGYLNTYGNFDGYSQFNLVDDGIVNVYSGLYSFDVNVYCVEGVAAFELPNGYWEVRETHGTQTRELAEAGWYWFSSYISDLEGTTGLQLLQSELNPNGKQIKGQFAFTNYFGSKWSTGGLQSVTTAQMYMLNTKAPVTLDFEGEFVDYSNTPIVLNPGWNWIGFPVRYAQTVEVALANLQPKHGDIIKGKNGSSIYYVTDEFEGWFPEELILEPGHGHMYYSTSDETVTFVFNSNGQPAESKRATAAMHWNVNETAYPSNMTMIATTDIEGGDYEVAAFVNGEVRGSARPIYVEALDAYVLVLTIQGNDVEEMTFRYYDITTGEEMSFSNRINYTNDAIIGSMAEPYKLTRGTTGIGEVALSDVNIYPNPTTTGVQVNLDATCEKVEIFNALGVKVAEYQNVDSIDAFETAGIYVIRLTNGGEIKHTRLVVR